MRMMMMILRGDAVTGRCRRRRRGAADAAEDHPKRYSRRRWKFSYSFFIFRWGKPGWWRGWSKMIEECVWCEGERNLEINPKSLETRGEMKERVQKTLRRFLKFPSSVFRFLYISTQFMSRGKKCFFFRTKQTFRLFRDSHKNFLLFERVRRSFSCIDHGGGAVQPSLRW